MGGIKAVILVGGPSKGTRFRPLSLDDVPKLLFPIAGRPMIYHHIEACSKVKGITEVILLGFFPENQLAAFIQDTSKELNIPIRYINEVKVLGTAGGLSRYRDQILSGSPDYVFILHSDICCSFPMQSLLEFHIKHSKICTIMGMTVEKKEYANHYGCLIRDENTNELLHYAEKPETFVSDFINCGVYCISPAFFDTMAKTSNDLHLSIQNLNLEYPEILKKGFEQGRLRLEQDIFVPLAGSGSIVVYPYSGFWRQIKNAGSPVYCQELYLNHYAKTKPEVLSKGENITGNVIIHPTATVDPTAKIGPNVYIGPKVKIGKGVRVLNSIILDETEVKDRACILYSIIGWRSEIGFWARIEGVPNYTPFLYNSQDKRKGITIFGAGAQANGEIIVSNCIVMPHKQLDRNYYNEIIL